MAARILVTALLGSLLVPIFGISAPQILPTATAAVSNGSIGLSSGGAARFSFATPLNTDGGATFETWIKYSSIAGENGIFAGCTEVGGGSNNCPAWFTAIQLVWSSSGSIRVATSGANQQPSFCTLNTSAPKISGPTINTWYHIALSIPSFTANTYKESGVFINGKLAGKCNFLMTNSVLKGVTIGGKGNSTGSNQIDIGPTRFSKIARYTADFTPQQVFPTSGDANIWAVTNTQHDTDNSAACTSLSDPNNKTLTFHTFATYQLINANSGGGTGGGAGTATVTCNVSSLVASDIATLSSASIKGETPTFGTPNSILGSAVAGQVTLTAAQATGGLASSFTKTDSGSTLNRIVKYASGATTANFETASTFANPSNDTIAFGDFFIIKITAADGTTVKFYRINVTVIRSIQSASLSLDPGVLIFRQAKELRATPSVAGRVTFRANGKVIPGCIKKAVLANATVTCSYLPSTRGSVTITATLDPSNSSYIGATTSSNNVIANRTGRRTR
jgi:hypothetical protein